MGIEIRQGDVLEARFELRERLLARATSELWSVQILRESAPGLLRIYRPAETSRHSFSHAVRESARSFTAVQGRIASIIDTHDEGELLITLIEYRSGRLLSGVPAPVPMGYRDVLRLARPMVEALLGVHEKGEEHGRVDDDHVLVADDGWVLLPPDLTVSPRRDTRQLGEFIAARLTAGRDTSASGHLNDTPELLHAGRTIPAMLNELVHELRASHVGSRPILLRDVLGGFDQLERLTEGGQRVPADGSGRSLRFVLESEGVPAPSEEGRSSSRIALAATGVAVIVLAAVVGVWMLWSAAPGDGDIADGREPAPGSAPVVAEEPARSETPVALEGDPSDADAALEGLLAARAEAEAIGASTWGGDAYGVAVATASQGDELYREAAYADAAERYRKAEAGFRAILDDSGGAYERLISEGQAALVSVNAEESRRAFEQALMIRPGGEEARIGVARAATIERVHAHLRDGAAHERADRLALALVEYSAAMSLDLRASEAAASHARVLAELADREFRGAMGRGLGAYHAGAPGEAAELIAEAERIRPGGEAAIALALAREAALRRRFVELGEAAREHAAREQWQEARGAFMRILEIDLGIESAQEGRRRAEAMIRLEVFSKEFIEDPRLLIQRGTREDAKRLLEEMREVDPIGPRLGELRRRLAELVGLANTAQTVGLRSDGLTEVEIYQVGQYQPFRERDVELLPGEYTIVGHRNGYRDVRLTVRVEPGGEPMTVRVVCTEPI